MEEVLKTIFEMQKRITSKLRAVGADSRDKAVTVQAAYLDFPAQNWLGIIAGRLFALIEKKQDKRYCSQLITRLVRTIPDCLVELCRKSKFACVVCRFFYIAVKMTRRVPLQMT